MADQVEDKYCDKNIQGKVDDGEGYIHVQEYLQDTRYQSGQSGKAAGEEIT